MPSISQLRGLSLPVAERFGKPHIRCHYKRENVDTNTLDDDAACIICGRMATNSHHWPPKGMGGKNRSFSMATPMGTFVLLPSLFAVCGSGTTGCHNGFHGGGRFTADWIWDSNDNEEAWWDGYLLSHIIAPHSPALFDYGCWLIKDRDTGREIKYRGDNR